MNRYILAAICVGVLMTPAMGREPPNSPAVAPAAAPMPPPPPPPAPPPPAPLDAPAPAPSAVPPSVTEPGPPEDSFPGFVNGKSTVDDVTAKFGRPTNEGHLFGPDGPYNYTYSFNSGAVIAVFLFTKDGVLVRVRVYQKNE